MKNQDTVFKFRSISEMHLAFGLPKPQHPLLSLMHFDQNNLFNPDQVVLYDVLDFYKITFVEQ